jgi:plasmid stabilization system protein ParE
VQRYEAKGIRRRVYGNYLIFYRVTGEQVFVIRVLHAARDTDALL